MSINNKQTLSVNILTDENEKDYNFKKYLTSKEYTDSSSKFVFPIGYDKQQNKFQIKDLKHEDIIYMSGMFYIMDSVVNTFIYSLLFRVSPEDLRMSIYSNLDLVWCNILPHRLNDIKYRSVTSKHFMEMLLKVYNELTVRRKLFEEEKISNIDTYNTYSYKKLPHIMFFMEHIRFRGETISQKDKEYIHSLLQSFGKSHLSDYGLHIVVSFSDGFPKDIQIEDTLKTLEDCATLKIKYNEDEFSWPFEDKTTNFNYMYISEQNGENIVNHFKS